MESRKLSGGSLLVSPQLWLSVSQKQPRTFLPSSRRLLQVPEAPWIQESTSDHSYVLVPSVWCVDNKVPSGTSYLSRDKLLRKMYQRRVHYRSFQSKKPREMKNSRLLKQDVEILGTPLDYWVTFPLNYNQEYKNISAAEKLEGVAISDKEATLVARCRRVKCTKEALIRGDVGVGQIPAANRLTFPWVTIANGTKFRTIEELKNTSDINRIDGFVECSKCGKISGVGYLSYESYENVVNYVDKNVFDFVKDSETLLSTYGFECHCGGMVKPWLENIGENYRKINWLFLLYGYGLGHCTEEQLRYFYKERNLQCLGNNKNKLICNVFIDICEQIDPESDFNPVL